jgi:hypothetical protein
MGDSMNLRMHNGRVPLPSNNPDSPIRLVDFPTKEVFNSLFGSRVTAQHLERYYLIMQVRLGGSTLRQIANTTGLSVERIRQIEAKFLRALAKHYERTERP